MVCIPLRAISFQPSDIGFDVKRAGKPGFPEMKLIADS